MINVYTQFAHDNLYVNLFNLFNLLYIGLYMCANHILMP